VIRRITFDRDPIYKNSIKLTEEEIWVEGGKISQDEFEKTLKLEGHKINHTTVLKRYGETSKWVLEVIKNLENLLSPPPEEAESSNDNSELRRNRKGFVGPNPKKEEKSSSVEIDIGLNDLPYTIYDLLVHPKRNRKDCDSGCTCEICSDQKQALVDDKRKESKLEFEKKRRNFS
jgi:hypothetical protein